MKEYILPAIKGFVLVWVIIKIIVLDNERKERESREMGGVIGYRSNEEKIDELFKELKTTKKKINAKDISVVSLERIHEPGLMYRPPQFVLKTDDNVSLYDVFKHDNKFYEVSKFLSVSEDKKTVDYLCELLF